MKLEKKKKIKPCGLSYLSESGNVYLYSCVYINVAANSVMLQLYIRNDS